MGPNLIKQKQGAIYMVFLVWLFLFLCPDSYSQIFKSLRVTQNSDSVKIQYDIVGGFQSAVLKVFLTVSDDGGNTFNVVPKAIYGDIGEHVSSGQNKLIVWLPLNDSLQLNGKNFVFNLSGSVTGAPGNIEMVTIKGGTFKMGDQFGEGNTDETFVHNVKLNDYALSEYEITNIQYAAFLKEYGSDVIKSGAYAGEPLIYESKNGLIKKGNDISFIWEAQPGKEYYPAVGVTWYGAFEFCRFYNYKLPSEAEWEYAAREAGKKIRFGNGKNEANISEIKFNGHDKIFNNKSTEGNPEGSTDRVGVFPPNKLGMYDMSGNVWEWCQDWYKSNYYLHSKSNEPVGPWLGTFKVLRGGSWYNSAFGIRTTVRSFIEPCDWKEDIGFRVAQNVSNVSN